MRSSASLLSRSRRPGIWCQSFSTSHVCASGFGRGRGRGDGADDASQVGYGGGVGRGAGFGNETQGSGRGRREGSVFPPSSSVATQPPLKSFVPAKTEPETVPDLGQQASKVFLEADGQAAKIDSRFEDAVTEKPFKPFKPSTSIDKPEAVAWQQRLAPENVSSELLHGTGRGSIPSARPSVPWNEDLKLHRKRGSASMDTWETQPRLSILQEQHRPGQEGTKIGMIGSPAEAKASVASTTKSLHEPVPPRFANNLGRTERTHGDLNVDHERARVWGSLSQILAAPGRTTSQPTPPLQSHPTSPPQNQPTPPLQSQSIPSLQDHPTPHPAAAAAQQTEGLNVPIQPAMPPAQSQMQNVPDVVQPENGLPIVTSNTQFQLSDESYVAMIRWHYQAGRFAEVDQVYEDMKADGVHVTVSTYNLLVEIYSKSGQFDKMDTVYKLMREALIKSKTSAAPPIVEQPPLESMSVAPETEKKATRDEHPEELVHAEEAAIEFHAVEKAPVPEPPISDQEAKNSPGQLSPRTSDVHLQTLKLIQGLPPLHTPIKEESKAMGMPPHSVAPSTDTKKPEIMAPGKVFAQHLEDSEGLHSFRGLPKQPPVGGPFEDSGMAGEFNPSILPNVPSAGAVAGRGRVGGFFEDSGRVGEFNPSMLPSVPSAGVAGGRGRGAALLDASGRVGGRGRGAPQGSPGQAHVSPTAIGAQAGQKERLPHTELSREQARERAIALLGKLPERQGTPAPRSVSPPRPQLSREDAVQRAVAVLQEGIDKNLTIEEERRRRGGPVDKFSDVTDFVANRFRRKGPDATAPRQGTGLQSKDRFKRQTQPRQRRPLGEDVPQVPLTLREMTAEDEERLKALDEEEQFKSALHTKFLLDFEPEYAMENFSDNPDIDDTPQISLEETMAHVKPYLLHDDITEEMWEEEVKDILGKAHHLKELVDLYAGPDRPTARQQKEKLEAIADTLPAHVLPEMADFTKMALLSLQSNPGIRLKEKERLMNKFVSGFSTF